MQPHVMRNRLLACGVVASALYVVGDAIGALSYPGYRYVDQAVSELSAVGAPSRPVVVPFFLAHSVLVLAFGIGVWLVSDGRRALRAAGALLAVLGALDLTAPLWPMHQRGAPATLTDTLHIAGTAVTVLLILLSIALASGAAGKAFRRFSIAAIAVLLVAGAVSGADGARVAAGLPTPWFGVKERALIFSYLLWQAALAVVLLRARRLARRERPEPPAGALPRTAAAH